jgi:hypothetical protein
MLEEIPKLHALGDRLEPLIKTPLGVPQRPLEDSLEEPERGGEVPSVPALIKPCPILLNVAVDGVFLMPDLLAPRDDLTELAALLPADIGEGHPPPGQAEDRPGDHRLGPPGIVDQDLARVPLQGLFESLAGFIKALFEAFVIVGSKLAPPAYSA